MPTKDSDTNLSALVIGQPSTATVNRGDFSAEGNGYVGGNATVVGALTAGSVALPTESATGGTQTSAGAPGMLYKAVSLSAANIIAMNATPVQLLPAPGAGKAIQIHDVMIRVTRTSTAFTSGGAAVIQTATGAVALTGTIPASTFTGAAGVADYTVPKVAAANVENDAVNISNATAAFATGTGTAVVHIWYSIV